MAIGKQPPTFTLNVNIPITDKEAYQDWEKNCKSEHADGRWQKMVSDHYKVKEIAKKLDEMEKKMDTILVLLDRLD